MNISSCASSGIHVLPAYSTRNKYLRHSFSFHASIDENSYNSVQDAYTLRCCPQVSNQIPNPDAKECSYAK